MMNQINTQSTTVVRTSRGLSIAGTRITLYSIMDCVKAGWPPKLIQDTFNLTDQQITDVMEYLKTHSEAVEAEYQQVLDYAEEERRYWETRNRERFAQIAAMSPPPGKEELWAKLQTKKAELVLL